MDEDTAARLAASIETQRLLLVPQLAAHAEHFFPALLHDEALYRWISMERPTSLEALRENWRQVESRLSPDGRVDAEIDEALEAANFGYCLFSPSAVKASPPRWSERVLRRAGFVITRVLPGHDCIDGVRLDDAEYVRVK